MYHRMEQLALASGRPTLQAQALHAATPGGARLPSPTGFGDVPANDPGARFLTQRGYRLEQIERISFLRLPTDRTPAEHASRLTGRLTAGQYSLVSWAGRTPDEWLNDLILLRTRMSTDAPSAGLDMDEEPWDAARIRHDDTAAEAGGGLRLTVAARHGPTGRLVGFSELGIPNDRSRPAHQHDTLVLQGHRGHRIGMALKAANLLAVQELQPTPAGIFTFNAEENRHMLDVNEALGFVAVGHEGCWRKN